MDNVCHTLVGAACARAGLTRPTQFGMATSMIAANLPDVDVLVFLTDVPSVAFRRGWTHGMLAQTLLPALLAVAMFATARRFAPPPDRAGTPLDIASLLVLSYVGVLSHVFLDLLNNYGVRLLMPFSGRWFYGDALFIVDPWLWIAFGGAVAMGRGGQARRTRGWLLIACVYIVAMVVSARAARGIVLERWADEHGSPPAALMVGPVPVNPFRKAVIVDAGDRYRAGTFTWLPAPTLLINTTVAKNDTHPATRNVLRDRRVAGVLVWSRFPFWTVAPDPDGTRITLRDMRFAAVERGGFTATVIVR